MRKETNLAVNPLAAVDAIVRRHNINAGATIPILQDIQNTFGFVAPEVLTRISDLTGISESELYSIVTFYAQFRLQPMGKSIISVCHGTACHLAGADKVTRQSSMPPVPNREKPVRTVCLPGKGGLFRLLQPGTRGQR